MWAGGWVGMGEGVTGGRGGGVRGGEVVCVCVCACHTQRFLLTFGYQTFRLVLVVRFLCRLQSVC